MRDHDLSQSRLKMRKRFLGSRYFGMNVLGKSVGVIVDLSFMSRMDVIVRTMVARVIMVMDQDVSMIMPMFVLVVMLVAVCVRVLMGMSHVSVAMFVRMAVGVFVGVQMLVLMVALHCGLLSFGVGVW